MDKIVITTESGSDLPASWRQEHQIRVVPFGINFPDRTVADQEIPVKEIYDFYDKTRTVPKTNAVGPYQYTQFFDEISEQSEGAEILHIGYSSACSCSFRNAVLGVQECKKAKVTLVDSKNVSGGLCNLVMKAVRLRQEHPDAPAEELAAWVNHYVRKTVTSFVPDRLDFLLAGGRVSNAEALGAAILRVKPRIDIVEGELVASRKYLGNMKKVSMDFIRDFLKDRTFDRACVYLFYSEGASGEVLERMRDQLSERGFENVYTAKLGCVMTIHGGKGAIGLSGTLV